MRCSVLCLLLLAISEPLLTHAKVVVIVPRQVRRSPAVPWRPPGQYKKASYSGNIFPRHAQYGRVNRYYKKPFRPLPYGGDDFDHGPEFANHVNVPYGKDISHGITVGKGYIPYDNIKNNNLPFVHERYPGAYGRQPAAPDYPPTSFTSVGQEYATSATAHSYENPQIDSFFSDMESAARGGGLKDNVSNKYYGTRSIEKDLSLRNQHALSSVIEKSKDSLAKGTEGLSPDTPPAAYAHAATASTSVAIPSATTGVQGAVVVPVGIPSATIAGNKDGIVLRDTVSLDEYQRKLEELTKTWPSVLSAGAHFATAGAISAPQQLHAGFPTTGLPGASFGGPTGGANWLSSFAQSKQGYAVREDHGDTTTYDFRTMGVQGAPYQQLSLAPHGGVSAGSGFVPSAHG
ncbi:PREDICTED: uncharacterized protein LOC105557593 [Vollenhovia emeryi]|uniref:uncharacterized protein LOC105557593 n=1 Tax=Vollenhovia emeryi TaxID=411798 RepID=UPI0005F481B6|nr:PREDICTED: uncharacterized protein LOC105557593 [Vollenhovia emeryi]